MSAKLGSVGSRFINFAGSKTAGTVHVSFWASDCEANKQRRVSALGCAHFELEWVGLWTFSMMGEVCWEYESKLGCSVCI